MPPERSAPTRTLAHDISGFSEGKRKRLHVFGTLRPCMVPGPESNRHAWRRGISSPLLLRLPALSHESSCGFWVNLSSAHCVWAHSRCQRKKRFSERTERADATEPPAWRRIAAIAFGKMPTFRSITWHHPGEGRYCARFHTMPCQSDEPTMQKLLLVTLLRAAVS